MRNFEKMSDQKENYKFNKSKELFNEQETFSQEEIEIALENPEKVGLVFDHELIIDPRSFFSVDEYLQYIKKRDGRIPKEFQSLTREEAEELLALRTKKEEKKLKRFNSLLDSLGSNLKNARVHPFGELSPLTPSKAVKENPEGGFEVSINPKFINQIKKIKERVENLTLVVQFYDHNREDGGFSDLPKTEEQRRRYIALCKEIIEQVGDDIQLEFGVEPNVHKKTGEMFERQKEQHLSKGEVNLSDYGEFIFEVARELKQNYPEIKISSAGVACFDPNYIKGVLTQVERLKKKEGIKKRLIDTISFHPYRENPEEGAAKIEEGEFVREDPELYEEQLSEMKELAEEFGVDLVIGEINFPESPQQVKKLKRAIEKNKEIKSFIYPKKDIK